MSLIIAGTIKLGFVCRAPAQGGGALRQAREATSKEVKNLRLEGLRGEDRSDRAPRHDPGDERAPDETPGAPGGRATRMRRLLATVALALIAVVAVEQLELTPPFPMTRMLMQTQDVPVLVLVAAPLLAMAAWRLPAAWGQWGASFAARTPYNLVVLILMAALVVALGTRHVIRGYSGIA